MTNLLSSISVALSSLLSQQQATTTYEHNVANVNTEGYHRQEAQLSAAPAVSLTNSYYGTGVGQMGTGVQVTSIKRYSIDFYDTRYRAENEEAAKWTAQRNIVAELETTLGETTTDGLLPKIDAFFTEWQSVSDNPTDISVRRELLDSAKDLASAINSRYEQINSIRSEQDLTITQDVSEINQLAETICGLNREISRIYSVGDSPNDLLDARDVALDRLAELTGATSFTQANGEVTVSINGHILVGGHESYPLHTELDSDSLTKIVWGDGKDLIPTSGELGGVFEARDTIFDDQLAGLNELAMTLKQRVNAIHSTGFGIDALNTTGLEFFNGNDAGSFSVNSDLDDVEKIAVSSASGEPGNNDKALLLYELRSTATMNANSSTFYQYYNDQVSRLGLTVTRATSNARQHALVADALDTQRLSVSGVSLNEEAANIVKSQKAYEAAARLVSTLDEMLDTIINGMGAGR